MNVSRLFRTCLCMISSAINSSKLRILKDSHAENIACKALPAGVERVLCSGRFVTKS